jgi:hypothetical protein
MHRLFDYQKFVYPLDDIGPYVEFTGKVIEVDDKRNVNNEWEEVKVSVQTERGIFSGYTPRPPKVGYYARIRLYNSGGGWYPDDRIVGWSTQSYDEDV